MRWDDPLHNQVGKSICTTSGEAPCDAEGYIRHLGHKFSPTRGPSGTLSMPVTANAEIPGLIGGYGWLLTFNRGAPRELLLTKTEIDPKSVLLLHIPYPVGTVFDIQAGRLTSGCANFGAGYTCIETMQSVSSVEQVRDGLGNKYYVHPNGVLTIRIVQISNEYSGTPEFILQDYDTPGRRQEWALKRFERGGVRLPQGGGGNYRIRATNCGGTDGRHCTGPVSSDYDPDVCAFGFVQTSYDRCCRLSNLSQCMYADGTQNF